MKRALASIRATLCASALLFAATASGQSLWSIHGPTASLGNQAGPPAGPCGYPTGPLLAAKPYAIPFACPSPGAFPAPQPGVPSRGDVAVDRVHDTVWATDGKIATGYTRSGAPFATFANPFVANAITGMGFGGTSVGASGPVLWITDGFLAEAVLAPGAGCGAATLVAGPWSVQFPGLATDVDFDPASTTVFVAYSNGMISSHTVAGAAGPFATFIPPATCGLGGLTGLCVDVATGGALIATDGTHVARFTFAGALAAPTFYFPSPCTTWSGPSPISGLAFDAAPIRYCKGCDLLGAPPAIGWIGEAISPNPAFALTLSQAAPGGGALLFLGSGAACPAPLIGSGCSLCVLPIVATSVPLVVPASGALAVPIVVPGGFGGLGIAAKLQWVVAKPAGGIQTTEAVNLTLALP